MTNNEIIVIYKEVCKNPVLKKIKNKLEVFEDLLGSKLDYIQYKDITIIARRDRKNLKANIYLNTVFLNIRDRNVRGNIILTCKNDNQFKSLTKEQAIKYLRFLQEESFNYDKLNKLERAKEYGRNEQPN